RRSLLLVPLIFGLWANLHGGWIVGLAVAGLWFIGRVLDKTTGPRHHAVESSIADGDALWPHAAVIAAGLVATLANPYGWRLWAFLLSTVRTSRNISEWRPVWQQDDATDVIL